jgi:hypothetical protein
VTVVVVASVAGRKAEVGKKVGAGKKEEDVVLDPVDDRSAPWDG